MGFFAGMSEISEFSEIKGAEGARISKESKEKFDKLMGDDQIGEMSATERNDKPKLNSVEREEKFSKLFDFGDFFKKDGKEKIINIETSEKITDTRTIIDMSQIEKMNVSEREQDYFEKIEPNSTYEFSGNIYETDDKGLIYKKNGKLFLDAEYIANGNKYKTNEYGSIVSCDSIPKYTEEGARNMKEQRESGGEERKEDDDGGHIIARILGGAEGEENLVPMRRTINRGDYKKMENEIAKALQENKEVPLHVDIKYDGDSRRPSKIQAEYEIDGKKTICEFDNVEKSTDLLDSLENKISDEDYNRLKWNLKEMKEDGCDAAITSIKIECDEKGSFTKVTVGILEEVTGVKKYREYNPRG